MRHVCLTIIVSALLLLSACNDLTVHEAPDRFTNESLTAEAAPSAVGSVEILGSFDPSIGQYPEGVAVSQKGELFVSITPVGQILRRVNGSWSVFATIDLAEGDLGVLGLAFDRRGMLHAAVVSSDPAVNGVWRFDGSGAGTHVPGTEAIAFANAVTFDARGTMYVSDSITGGVWRVRRDGGVEPWIVDDLLQGNEAFGLGFPIGANGLAFSPRSGRRGEIGVLYVAVTEAARLVAVPITPSGDAGMPRVVAEGPALFGLDGIVEDERGKVFGAVNILNQIVSIDPASGTTHVVADSDLDFPASLAMGTSGRERHALFVTNFALANEIDPAPGVARIDLGPPGRR